MQKYRILVLDIDGTLVYRDRQTFSARLTDKLHALRQQGVMIAYATGRSPFACEPDILGTDFLPDYRICVNGSCIYDRAGNILYERRLNTGQIHALIRFCTDNGHLLTMTFEDSYEVYIGYEAYVAFYRSVAGHVDYLKDGTKQDRHLQSLPFGAYAVMPPEARDRFCANNPGIKMMQSVPNSFDICSAEADKAEGVGMILEQLGMAWSQAVFIGDGENDLGILSRAGMGVAMGGAPEVVRVAAGYVAPDIQEEGALAAMERFF